ncbi:zinc finger, CCHC-type containing protein [Tanacetum coccineum]
MSRTGAVEEVVVKKAVSTAEVTTVSATTTTVDELTLAQTLIEIKAAKPKAFTTDATTTTTTITRPKARGVIVQEPKLMDKRKKHFARLRVEEQRRKPPTKAQKRNQMCTYLKNMAGFTHSQLKNKSFNEVQKAFDKTMSWIDLFVSMDSEVVKGEQERIKKQKINDDKKEAEMKKHMEIVVDEEEIAVDAIPLATKPPIINIDRKDLETLWKLVKAKHRNTRPEEAYERVLWGDLKVMFELDVESMEKSTRIQCDSLETIFFKWSTFCEISESAYLYAGREKGRIVRIKRLHDDLGVYTVKVRVTAAKHNLVMLNIVNDNIGSAFMSTSKLNDLILWHARLCHVHFKRMQYMSKDGLIPAFDMDTKNDLCDLHATPSLGNKNYFVTFIDDASRFCYVYILHSKDEALDKFKAFKTEVELQQGSLIKRFRTDKGGLSQGFWGEAMKPNLNYLRGWGCMAVVRLPDPKLKTLGERGIKCIFVGYAKHSKAFRFYVIEPNKSVLINSIIESRDAIFNKNRFSSVPRLSLKIPNRTEDISGSVVPGEVTEKVVQQPKPKLRKSKKNRTPKNFVPKFQLYLIEGTRGEVSDQHSYCFNVEDDPKTFDEAMKS